MVSNHTSKLQDQDAKNSGARLADIGISTHDLDTQDHSRLQQINSEGLRNPSRPLDSEKDEKYRDIDADSIEEEDDDDDAQSFLDLLEPLEVPLEPVLSPTYSLSESSSEELDQPNSADSAYRSRRMLIACGGNSITVNYRRKENRSGLSSSVPEEGIQRASPDRATRSSSVSNSDPEVLLETDDSCNNGPQL